MSLFWFEIGFGLLIILILIVLSIKFSKQKTTINDEKALKIIHDELERDGHYNFELESITSIDNPKIISVIVRMRYQEIGIEINKNSGEILSKERIARQ
ncbi:hypothetical protein [Nitrosopumilus sp. b2]|uniref:hypothetical protein n=1 Tax=Nitrosopumilus sp. b2 TaxID=2109908 RepID=UPI0015F6F888|nr:hypothetical protein [Nitrosopumilus sp. b2]KAF6244936.1 hypothetical protein C6989_06025 [Nitrosopumilus sp. b2]